MTRDDVLAIHAAELARCEAAPAAEALRVARMLAEIEPAIVAANEMTAALLRSSQEGSAAHLELQGRLVRLHAQKAALTRPTNERPPAEHAWMGTRTRVHEQLQADHPGKGMSDLWPLADKLVAEAGLVDPTPPPAPIVPLHSTVGTIHAAWKEARTLCGEPGSLDVEQGTKGFLSYREGDRCTKCSAEFAEATSYQGQGHWQPRAMRSVVTTP